MWLTVTGCILSFAYKWNRVLSFDRKFKYQYLFINKHFDNKNLGVSAASGKSQFGHLHSTPVTFFLLIFAYFLASQVDSIIRQLCYQIFVYAAPCTQTKSASSEQYTLYLTNSRLSKQLFHDFVNLQISIKVLIIYLSYSHKSFSSSKRFSYSHKMIWAGNVAGRWARLTELICLIPRLTTTFLVCAA